MNRIVYMCLKNIPRIPSAWFKLCKYAKNPDKYTRKEMADHIRYIMKIAVKSGNINLKVTGTEMLPKEDGFILYGNHQGMFDAVAMLAAFDRPLSAVFKKELSNIPFAKQVIACTESHAMDREDVRQSMEVIFPEGTRSKNGNNMGEFHAGSFKCAQKAKCPIVPFAFIDSYHVLDKDGTDPMDVQLHFLEPIPYEEYKSLKTPELAALVKERIQKVIDENT